VTLIPRKQPVSLKAPLQLTITAAGLPDTSGRPIDGNGDGQPGGNYVATLSKIGVEATVAVRSANPAAFAPDAVDAVLASEFRSNTHRAEA
jgi:hypothetical protein